MYSELSGILYRSSMDSLVHISLDVGLIVPLELKISEFLSNKTLYTISGSTTSFLPNFVLFYEKKKTKYLEIRIKQFL